jgi:hypothetical protein
MFYKKIPILSLAICFACSMIATQTHAQSIGAELGLFGDSDSFTLSPLFNLQIPVAEDWAVAGEMGFIYTDTNSDNITIPGNLGLGVIYTITREIIDLSVGFDLGLPIASFPNNQAGYLAQNEAIAIRGMWDLWLWRDQTLSFVFPLKLVFEALPLLNIRGDAAAGGLVSVSKSKEEHSEFLLQLGGEAGLVLGVIELGVRLQFVWLPTQKRDNAQVALEPYALLKVKPAFARVGLMMNLTKPYGFAFDHDRYWGVLVSGGIEF